MSILCVCRCARPTPRHWCVCTPNAFISEDSSQLTGSHFACTNRELEVIEEYASSCRCRRTNAPAPLPQKVTTLECDITQSSLVDRVKAPFCETLPGITPLLGFLPFSVLCPRSLTCPPREHIFNKSLAHFWGINVKAIGQCILVGQEEPNKTKQVFPDVFLH